LDKVDAFVALTQFSRRKFVAGGMPAEKIFVKPNFVSPDPGEREGEGEYALFAGRLSAEKGILTLLAAWRELGGRIPLCVVGDGPARSDLESQLRASCLPGVTFLGRIDRDRVLQVMKRARLLIFPSELYENFPLTIVEAFACGVPVLASRMGAMPEIVKEQHNGLLFEPGNGADLAAKVRQVWNDSAALHRMGKNARGDFLENYTAERNCRLLMDIYDRVVAARRELFREALLPDFVSTTSS
jgi:glycosyltransferase involved in cell wall biosynthesis